jgi:hypothetical protein
MFAAQGGRVDERRPPALSWIARKKTLVGVREKVAKQGTEELRA